MKLEPSGRPVGQILDDAVAGRRISAGDAHTLLLDADLLDLGLAAHKVRNRFNDSEIATYNIDRNINYTNACTAVWAQVMPRLGAAHSARNSSIAVGSTGS